MEQPRFEPGSLAFIDREIEPDEARTNLGPFSQVSQQRPRETEFPLKGPTVNEGKRLEESQVTNERHLCY